MTKKFVIVSNRLPISVAKKDGKLEFSPSSGGLATALSRLKNDPNKRVWIGWPGIASDKLTAADKAEITRKLKTHNCFPVFLSKKQIDQFYDGYSNDTIWPLFHYFQTLVNYKASYWKGYKEVNEIYSKAVMKHASADSYIWIHDYHLMLLPKLVRSSISDATIGFFLHVPFPSHEIFRLLPNRTEILEGLLGADLIGFHIYDYARHFLSSALRILGVENNHGAIVLDERTVRVDAFPIGIDYEKFAKSSENKETKKQIEALQQHYKGKKIILSMDRLDYSKGILSRLNAYEKFLSQNPSWIKKLILVVVAVPSRTEVETYKELRMQIETTISRINGKYGEVDWMPISYQFKNLPFHEVAALFWVSDIALLTPLRDGMNLVAKEYVATKQGRPGVLILSEMTGAVDELPEATRINPNNIEAIVQSIKMALKMPKSTQIQKITSMQRRLSKYTIDRWSEDFIEQLHESKHSQMRRSSKLITKQAEAKILRNYLKAKKRLILLDYDGTIRNYVSTFDSKRAVPSNALKELIKSLADNPKNEVCIVSGRPRNVLDSWFGDMDVLMSAEHGAWVKNDNEWSRQQVSLSDHREQIISIMKRYADRTPGALIEQKDFAIVWHYRNVPVELAHARNANLNYELNQLLANSDFDVHHGAKIIEIKPKNIHKGIVAEEMLAIFEPDFVLAIGDDYTDEDMFRVVPDEAITIKVGLGETGARFQLISVEDALKFLKKLT